MNRPCRPLLWLSCGAMLLAVSALASGAYGDEVVETYADGSIRLRYETNESGQAHGKYIEYHPNGKLKVVTQFKDGLRDGSYTEYRDNGRVRIRTTYRGDELQGNYTEHYDNNRVRISATYRRDVLHGRFVERYATGGAKINARYANGALEGEYKAWDEAGSLLEACGYRSGSLHGERRLYVGKSVASIQVWSDGRIERIDGVEAYPRPAATVRDELRRIAMREPLPDTALATQRHRDLALRRLQSYRFLCGVPYADIDLVEDLCILAREGARICATLDKITHTPDNPGWPESEYRPAYEGASNCNLYTHSGDFESLLVRSVDFYMDDSDADNIDAVGHRRWCLNPKMNRTGFGESGAYAAMWSTDQSRSPAPSFEFVAFPPPGHIPLDFLPANTAWSISPHPDRFDLDGEVTVTVHELDATYCKTGGPLPLTHLRVSSENIGSGPCIIFRPTGIRKSPDARYWVEVRGVAKRRRDLWPPIRYLVHVLDVENESVETE